MSDMCMICMCVSECVCVCVCVYVCSHQDADPTSSFHTKTYDASDISLTCILQIRD